MNQNSLTKLGLCNDMRPIFFGLFSPFTIRLFAEAMFLSFGY